MPLNDQEIKYLLDKAALYKNAKEDDLPYLKQSLECYDLLIGATPPHHYYFKERSDVKYRLSGRLNRPDLLEGSLEDIDEAIRLNPDKGEYYCLRGTTLWTRMTRNKQLMEKEVLEKVVCDYRAALAKDPTEPLTWLNLMAAGIVRSDWDDVVGLYGQCKPYLKCNQDMLIRAYLGSLAFIQAGDPLAEVDLALLQDAAVRIAHLYGREVHVCTFLGEKYQRETLQGKWARTVEIMRLLIGHFDNPYARGNLFYHLKLREDELKAYCEAAEMHPGDYIAWYEIGRIRQSLKHYREALSAYDKALELRSDDPDSLNKKAETLYYLGLYQESLRLCEYIISLDSENSLAWLSKGTALWGLMRFQESLSAYDQVISIKPDDAAAWNNRGTALERLGRDGEALASYEKAIALAPDYLPAWRNKGVFLRRYDRREEALACLAQALELDPDYTEIWNDKGYILQELGRYEEALAAYDKALALDPDHSLSQVNKKSLKKLMLEK